MLEPTAAVDSRAKHGGAVFDGAHIILDQVLPWPTSAPVSH